jgi:hypothetical protein
VSQSAHQAELRKEAEDAAEAERTRALLDEEKKAHERAARKARARALLSTLMRVCRPVPSINVGRLHAPALC